LEKSEQSEEIQQKMKESLDKQNILEKALIPLQAEKEKL